VTGLSEHTKTAERITALIDPRPGEPFSGISKPPRPKNPTCGDVVEFRFNV